MLLVSVAWFLLFVLFQRLHVRTFCLFQSFSFSHLVLVVSVVSFCCFRFKYMPSVTIVWQLSKSKATQKLSWTWLDSLCHMENLCCSKGWIVLNSELKTFAVLTDEIVFKRIAAVVRMADYFRVLNRWPKPSEWHLYQTILVPRGCIPFCQHQESQPLGGYTGDIATRKSCHQQTRFQARSPRHQITNDLMTWISFCIVWLYNSHSSCRLEVVWWFN